VTDGQLLKILGGNIRKVRLAREMTQEGLAELTGVHWQTISYLEKGKHPVSVVTFIRIVQVLQLSPEVLLEGISKLDQPDLARVAKAVSRKRRPAGASSEKKAEGTQRL
jgi:transcriptional regulator with XRE-family HTH domain